MTSKKFLVQALRHLDREHGPEVITIVNVRPDDPFDWSSLEECCDCGLPGIDYGQTRDCRYPTDGPEGLHGHVYNDRVAFHLDAVDACRDVVNHGIKDTRAIQGAVVGGLLAAALAALSGSKSVGTALMAGGVAGAALGATVPARQSKVVEFRDVVAVAQRVRPAFA